MVNTRGTAVARRRLPLCQLGFLVNGCGEITRWRCRLVYWYRISATVQRMQSAELVARFHNRPTFDRGRVSVAAAQRRNDGKRISSTYWIQTSCVAGYRGKAGWCPPQSHNLLSVNCLYDYVSFWAHSMYSTACAPIGYP